MDSPDVVRIATASDDETARVGYANSDELIAYLGRLTSSLQPSDTAAVHIRVGDQDTQVLDLNLHAIYADVIEGVPDATVNARIIESAVQVATRRYGLSPYLVAPTPRPIHSSFGPKEALPPICCSARVRGGALDANAEHAEASLVWFQDAISTTLAPEVADALQLVSWAEIARDDYW